MRNTRDERMKIPIDRSGRVLWVDCLRGCAIILMVIYHFVFDLDYLSFIHIDLDSGFWFLFPRAIGSLFLFVAGISIVLSENRDKAGKREGYLHHLKRGAFLAIVACAITLATWVYPHEGFISFGIIHLIALSTLIAPFFLRFGRLNALIGLIFIALGAIIGPIHTDSHYLFWLGITFPGYSALDYYPLIPWFGVILIGISAGQVLFAVKRNERKMTGPYAMLAFLGRNSLAIYLAHQVVLFGILLAYRMVMGA